MWKGEERRGWRRRAWHRKCADMSSVLCVPGHGFGMKMEESIALRMNAPAFYILPTVGYIHRNSRCLHISISLHKSNVYSLLCRFLGWSLIRLDI